MEYFTPELYLRYNTDDDRKADDAEKAWERAIGEYKLYLKEHRSRMPPNVRALAEKCCFHDAMLLRWQTHEQAKTGVPRTLTIGLQQDDEIVLLCYFLSESPKETRRRKAWPFSAAEKHWLYDEIGVAKAGASPGSIDDFVHRILWSDGSELEIPFVDVFIDEYPSLTPAVLESDQ